MLWVRRMETRHSTSQALQNVFLQHNTSGSTTPETSGSVRSRQPIFVVLDEPNVNLYGDRDRDRALADGIQMLRKRRVTIVIINHRPNLLASVDKNIFMHEGRIAAPERARNFLPLLVGETVATMRRAGRSVQDVSMLTPARTTGGLRMSSSVRAQERACRRIRRRHRALRTHHRRSAATDRSGRTERPGGGHHQAY
jgi:energy-coupling factor transporter ATP-binding protein EcfA2